MTPLFDQNLSRRLVVELAPWFPDRGHAAALGIERATDREGWAHAGERCYLIVSKDSDLRQFAFLVGPPAEGGMAPHRRLLHLGTR